MNENMRGMENPSNMPTQRERSQSDPESRLNNNIQVVKNDLEKDIQTVKNDLEKDVQTVKNDLEKALEKNIGDIKTTLTNIENRLRNVETDVAELKGRRLAFKEWIPIGCAVIAVIVSIIALVKN